MSRERSETASGAKPRGGQAVSGAKPRGSETASGAKPRGGRGDVDEFQTQVIMTIFHMMGNLRHSGAALPEIELSYPQVLVLFALLETGTNNIGGLSAHLNISQGVMSRTVDRLVEKGLVDRVRDSEDRRVVRVSLSESGRGYATGIVTYHVDKLGDQFSKIPREQREMFLDLLQRIDALLAERDER